jgi:hypothetical protein
MSEHLASGDNHEVKKKTSLKRARPEVDSKEALNNEPSNKLMKLPQKKFYRQRAHVNPLAFNKVTHYHPDNPERWVISFSCYF